METRHMTTGVKVAGVSPHSLRKLIEWKPARARQELSDGTISSLAEETN